MNDQTGYLNAIEDFHKARQKAALEKLFSRFTGKSFDLLPYEEIRRRFLVTESAHAVKRDIPVDAIIGSVSRYGDFSRTFLPLKENDRERWAKVKVANEQLVGLEPIRVYQVGEVYFVIDGHHRISIARENGATSIEAYVIPVQIKVPITPEDNLEDIVLKAEYASFLEKTRIDILRPSADLRVTEPGQYQVLLEHISVHHYYMGIDLRREVAYSEAVAHFYDTVYLPVIKIIRQKGLLSNFPNRTEADLYLWLTEYRESLQAGLHWRITIESAAKHLVNEYKPGILPVLKRSLDRFVDLITPDELEGGPSPGYWRQEMIDSTTFQQPFPNILVAISGTQRGWSALEWALGIASLEGSFINGLHVVQSESALHSPTIQEITARFDQRCAERGIKGKLALDVGKVTRVLTERSTWSSLMVLPLAYPPPEKPFSRLKYGLRTLIHRCSIPILAVPNTPFSLSRILLAYDGSPKSEEALYLSTYIASRWQYPLTVVNANRKSVRNPPVINRASKYLEEHAVPADFLEAAAYPEDLILEQASIKQSSLIIMGGYGTGPILELLIGSTVDRVLQKTRIPVLICR